MLLLARPGDDPRRFFARPSKAGRAVAKLAWLDPSSQKAKVETEWSTSLDIACRAGPIREPTDPTVYLVGLR